MRFLYRMLEFVWDQVFTSLVPAGDFFWVFLLFSLYMAGIFTRGHRKLEARRLGGNPFPFFRDMVVLFLWGLFGGILASWIFSVLGITISFGEVWIFPVILGISLFLSTFHARFLCASYALGILAAIRLIFGVPALDFPAWSAFIGGLHLAESIFMFATGASRAVPVCFRIGDRATAGYVMQKVWPVVMMFFFWQFISRSQGGLINLDTPSWWPLWGPAFASAGKILVYFPVVFPVTMGYSDFTLSRTPREKAVRGSLLLGCYSLTTIAVAGFVRYLNLPGVLAAFAVTAGHELVTWNSYDTELKNPWMFSPVPDGLRVLYVSRRGLGAKLGLTPGDVIKKINGRPVLSRAQLLAWFNGMPWFADFEIIRPGKGALTLSYPRGIKDLGILVVDRETVQADSLALPSYKPRLPGFFMRPTRKTMNN
ncbi:MAG: hypothetical protein ACM3WV_07985 [Bacillota bacterium]